MASILKRNKSYFIAVSCGYDQNGRQIRRTMTYKPNAKPRIPSKSSSAADIRRNKIIITYKLPSFGTKSKRRFC